MTTLAFGEPGLITDVKLIDLLFAIKVSSLAKEPIGLIDELIYAAKNSLFLGQSKFLHQFDYSMSAPEFLPSD